MTENLPSSGVYSHLSVDKDAGLVTLITTSESAYRKLRKLAADWDLCDEIFHQPDEQPFVWEVRCPIKFLDAVRMSIRPRGRPRGRSFKREVVNDES